MRNYRVIFGPEFSLCLPFLQRDVCYKSQYFVRWNEQVCAQECLLKGNAECVSKPEQVYQIAQLLQKA